MPRRRLLVAALSLSVGLASGAEVRSRPPDLTDVRADSLFDAGEYDSLLSLATREIARASARGDSIHLGRMIFCRGRARFALHQPGAGEDFDEALSYATATRDTVGQINAIGLRSFVAVVEGRLDESMRLSERRLALSLSAKNRRGEGWAHLLIGFVDLERGDPASARSHYESAAEAFRIAKRPREELTALIGLGRSLDNLGRVDEARDAYARALARARALGDASQEADAWNNLGDIAWTQGELALAARNFGHAYEIKKRLGVADAADVGGNLAFTHTQIGRYAAAESVLVDAIGIANAWHHELGVGRMQNQFGDLRLAQGRPRGAEAQFRRVLAHADSLSTLVAIPAITGLAEALIQQQRVDEAVAVLDSGFVGLASSPPSAMRAAAFTTWAKCLRLHGDPDRATRAAATAWEDAISRTDTTAAILAAVERADGLCLGGDRGAAYAWFQRARAMYPSASRRSGDYQWREAHRASLGPALIRSATILLDWPPTASREDRARALFDFLQEAKSRTLLERTTDPLLAGELPPGFVAPVGIGELQAGVLRPGECLLDLSVGRDRLYLFAVTRDSLRLRVVDDDGGTHARTAARFLRLAGQAPRHGALVDMREPGESLSDLLSGFADLIRASPSLVVAAGGWLASMPFAVITLPGERTPLIASHRVTYVPAASLLRNLRATRAATHAGATVLAIAPVDPELAGARREVRNLQERYAAVTRLDSVPSLDAFTAAVTACDVLHVASHVRVDTERPWHSGIQVNDADARFPYLRASQIAHERFDGALVVLSGCESALGRATQGEGVLGLSSAFVSAGARSVVATLWAVDDRVTAELMEDFYAHLASGESVSSALWAAQLRTRARHPHPFYWAGFVATGDGDLTIPLSPRRHSRILLLLFALAGMAAVAASIRFAISRRTSTV